MPLAIGTRLGPYEVVSAIGAGGMGEVYRARDTKLGRDVALKILSEVFASDPDRLARFQREAQVLASLNHQNIAAIHGLEDSAGIHALVLELVEGPTLADRIAQGPISLDEALPIARQIAEALEAAHDHGIIHRDLKPANVKLRSDGVAKVLDFGLAKAMAPEKENSEAANLSMSPTLTTPAATRMGVILGTAAYMSPEQAKARPVDKRTDVWAFGCTLFEMLTGRRAFEGDDVSDTMASVLKSDPDWSALPVGTPSSIERLLRRCLAKDRKARVSDIGVARYEIEEALTGSSTSAAEKQKTPVAPPAIFRRAIAVIGAALAAGVVVGVAVWVPLRPRAQPIVRLTATSLSPEVMARLAQDSGVAITPDGRRIVYATVSENSEAQTLNVRALDELEATPLKVPGNPRSPFISPDGNWVGFFDGATLKKVSVNGGPPVRICAVQGVPRGASWGQDDAIVFAAGDTTTGLMRVSAAGGTPEALTKPDVSKKELDHVFPEILPGGRAVLFTITATGTGGLSENAQIAVLDLTTGRQKVLLAGGNSPHFAPPGYLVYGIAGTLRAVPFDLKNLEVRGSPVPVVQRVVTRGNGAASFSLASDGTLVYLAGDPLGSAIRSLVWVDRQGREEAIPAPPRAYTYARVSPDRTKLALDIRDQDNDIWIWRLGQGPLTRLTFDPGLNRGAVWSPDSKRVAFSVEKDGPENVYWQNADGTGTAEQLTQGSRAQFPNFFTPDRLRLVYMEPGAPPYDLGVVNVNGDRKESLLLHASYSEGNSELSPDGRWLAYESNESGLLETYVRPFPKVDEGRWQVSTGGGTRPAWARSGRELFYWQPPGKIVAVSVPASVQAGTSFTSLPPKRDGRYLAPQYGRPYDVSPDGQRFVMIKDAQPVSSAPTDLVVVLNWVEELRQKVPR